MKRKLTRLQADPATAKPASLFSGGDAEEPSCESSVYNQTISEMELELKGDQTFERFLTRWLKRQRMLSVAV